MRTPEHRQKMRESALEQWGSPLSRKLANIVWATLRLPYKKNMGLYRQVIKNIDDQLKVSLK